MQTNKIFIILLVFMAVFTTACRNDMKEIRAFAEDDTVQPDIIAYDFETYYTTHAKLQVKLTAPIVRKYLTEDPYFEFPEGLLLLFYDDSKNVKTRLVADYAIYYDEKEYGRADGNVVITNADSTVLRSEQLYIDQKNEKIYSKKHVNITEPNGYVINGMNGFESNLNFTVYTFWKSKGVIPFEGEFEEIQSKSPTQK